MFFRKFLITFGLSVAVYSQLYEQAPFAEEKDAEVAVPTTVLEAVEEVASAEPSSSSSSTSAESSETATTAPEINEERAASNDTMHSVSESSSSSENAGALNFNLGPLGSLAALGAAFLV